MPVESYYAPTKHARLTLPELAERLTAAGLPCTIGPEATDMFWLAFDPLESSILASVQDGVFVFGTYHSAGSDPVSVDETVDRVMQSIGFSADEGADY